MNKVTFCKYAPGAAAPFVTTECYVSVLGAIGGSDESIFRRVDTEAKNMLLLS